MSNPPRSDGELTPGEQPSHPKPRSRARRVLQWFLIGGVALFVATVVLALVAAFLAFPIAKGWWDEAVSVADSHIRYQTSHPGWSFPAHLRTLPTALDRPIEELILEAKARGYAEDC